MYWMTLPLKRYFEFSGRSRRLEYWMFVLFQMIVMVPIAAIFLAGFPWQQIANPDPAYEPEFGPLLIVGSILIVVVSLGLFIPGIAVTVRRLHDRNMSGWWYGGLFLASFIPLINILTVFGFIAIFVIMFLPGTPGPNRFGPDPKDPSQARVFE